MLRVKTETYKQLKQIALDFDNPLTKLIDKLLEEHQNQKVDRSLNRPSRSVLRKSYALHWGARSSLNASTGGWWLLTTLLNYIPQVVAHYQK